MSSDTAAPPIGHKTVLALALPIVLSNVSEPLIGIVDTAVIGQLGAAHLIGAVALGGIIFAFAFWAFGFLRMGTTGLTAQASGARNPDEIRAVLARAGGVALIAGLGLIVLQAPIATLSFWLLEGSDKAEAAARNYFDIRIWSAPFALANYTMLGWFIGLGRTMIAFTLQLVLNLTNIALDALLVLWLGMGVEGVALGTLLAEVIAALGGRADVLGHSMGGKAAMVLALSRPEMVRRLLVADIAPVAYEHSLRHLIEAMQGLDLARINTREEADAALARTVEAPELRAFLLQSLDLKAKKWRLNLDVLGRDMELVTGFPETRGRFDGPVLFLSGAESDYVRPEHRARIQALFPRARFARIPGAGHWLHAERPRAFLAAAEVFFNR